MTTTESPKVSRLSWRRIGWVLLAVVTSLVIAYVVWTPGIAGPLPADRMHGAWLTHAWWGDEAWFADSERKRVDYFGKEKAKALAERLHGIGVRDWYIHGGPARANGSLPLIDVDQARLLVEANRGGQVLAWVGGVLDHHCFPDDAEWRTAFARSCSDLVRRSGIAGIQLNIEPCASFTEGYLELLEDLRKAMPNGARLSVAAYPPSHWLHSAPSVHWSESFVREVSRRSDDLCVMAYDTAQKLPKPYTYLVARWTRQVIAWSEKPVRIGLPAYAEFGKPWHHPHVENLRHALPGLAAGLKDSDLTRYAGWAVYAEWTMTDRDMETLRLFQPVVVSDP